MTWYYEELICIRFHHPRAAARAAPRWLLLARPCPPPSSRCAPSACAPSRVQLILLLPLPLLPLVLPALLPMPLLVLLLPLLPSLLLLLLLLPLLLPLRPSVWPPRLITFVTSPL